MKAWGNSSRSYAAVIDANDIKGRGEEIVDLFGKDKITEGIVALLTYVQEFSEEKDTVREATVISADYRNLEKALVRKSIDDKEFSDRRRPLLYQALELKDSVAESLTRH